MTPEELARVKSLHSRALQLPDSEREEFLRRHLAESPDLLEAARNLLTWSRDAGDFMETPLAHRLIEALTRDLPIHRIGPYKLVRELGHGGSATVYLASRADDLFEKHVAIKVMSRLAHSGEAFRRFQRETRILARLEHPYIVRLLEAGTTGEALSYIVTEFVDGVRIDEFSSTLALDAKVRLFLKVCDAVSAAHRALVVHRDLKPSNILVTADGTPKVLDFGIAVLLDQNSQLTKTGLERMTVYYASPEQLRCEKSITTSTDVYSLGVLLYKLISGRVPYEHPEHEMALRIAAQDPPTLNGVPRDLAAIARMALQSETAARYASVDSFRDDLNRYLEGLPVIARGDGAAYRLRKLARRHWPLVAAPALLLVSLAAFSIVLSLSLRESKRQVARVRAMVLNSLPEVMREGQVWVPLRTRKYVQAARIPYLDALSSEYPRDEEIRDDRWMIRQELGVIEGLPSEPNLGDTAGARRDLEQAVQIAEGALSRRSTAEFRRRLAVAYLDLGSVLLEVNEPERAQQRFASAEALEDGSRIDLESIAQRSRILVLRGRHDEALVQRRRIVEERRRLFAREGPARQWAFAGSLCSYGELLRETGRSEEAEKSYSEALPLIDSLVRAHPHRLDYIWHLARENEEYARVVLALNRWPESRIHFERAIALYRQIQAIDPDAMSNQRALAVCLGLLGAELKRYGDPTAHALLQEALQLSQSAAAQDPASYRAQQELAMVRAAQ
jgi:serine/threonine protein kinase